VAGAGDTNGDGFDDLVVGAPSENSHAGAAYVYLGAAGVGGLSPMPPVRLAVGSANQDWFGFVAEAGDTRGHGFSDVVVGANGANGGLGAVYVFGGASAGIDPMSPTVLLGSPPEGRFGYSVAFYSGRRVGFRVFVVPETFGVAGDRTLLL
jgi:hypothetical protein